MSYHHRHAGPFYAYLTQTHKGNVAGDWHRWLVIAATREDMKTFFRGLQKYSKTANATITDVHPTHLAWWTFKSPDGFYIRTLLTKIYQDDPAWYQNIDELKKSSGKINVMIMEDAGGNASRNWTILPEQDVSLDDF